MAIYRYFIVSFALEILKLVIFNSYVQLPEDNFGHLVGATLM